MCTGADAANAFNECPGVSRIATFQDNLRAAPHGAGRHSVSNDIITVDIHFAAHMPFDAGNRVHDQTTAGVVNGITGFDTGYSCLFILIVRLLFGLR